MGLDATEKTQNSGITMCENSIDSTVVPFFKTSTDLQKSYDEISAFCHTHSAPVFITKDGQTDLVVMSIEYYEKLARRVEHHGLLKEGIQDIEENIHGGDSLLRPKLIQVEAVEPMKLRLHYENGEVRVFDVEPYAKGSWFGQLRDPEYFRTVRLLTNGTGIEWSNGQDIAPHELYELSVFHTPSEPVCITENRKGSHAVLNRENCEQPTDRQEP